jgi:hypothetical protein
MDMHVCLYEYYSFSPHNGVTTANVHILNFSPVNDNFDIFNGLINIIII